MLVFIDLIAEGVMAGGSPSREGWLTLSLFFLLPRFGGQVLLAVG